jgi:hypothetical protein
MNQLDSGARASSNATLERSGRSALQAKNDLAVEIQKPLQAKDAVSKAWSSGVVASATISPAAVLSEREPWSIASGYGPRSLDRAFKANLAKLTFGLSPAVMAEQTFDWMAHFAFSPQTETPIQQGSWWVEWHAWLDQHSTGRTSSPAMGAPEKGYAPRRDAPGLYVRQP